MEALNRSSAMSSHQEDLDLLLSLQDRVLETPPGSPSNSHSLSPGYLSDDGSPRTRRRGQVDMSVFKDVVEDCLDYELKPVEKNDKLKSSKKSKVADFEKFSGLRIRSQLLSPAELSDYFSDIRFVRLPTIKNVIAGETLSGCWATIGILYEKGDPKTSSIGKKYSIWKMGCLNNDVISLFMFGDAYQQNWNEQLGTVFGLFNCSVRKDSMGSGFSLSVCSASQILKIGISVDFGICEGKRKDGTRCTSAVNKYVTCSSYIYF
ncbi:protein MCM10 homolog [Carica papaya]|uniref:protein MCM10 homolog n=1 Tax=Carica papaya TaxID=3649 RepID=UPI000B8C8AA4|nr:protein MCM10 homolog [Carica papaya]